MAFSLTKRRALNCGAMWNSIGYRTASNYFFSLSTRRGFASDDHEPTVIVENAQAEEVVENAQAEDEPQKEGAVALPPQILVPMPEHPVFPGYSSVIALSEEQYNILS